MIRSLKSRLEQVSRNISRMSEKIGEVVEKNTDVLLSLNRDQMLLGRDADGNVLSPSYLDDPYFTTPQKAQRYAMMKYSLEVDHRARIENPTLYPAKDRDTPNLIVSGQFQDAMFIQTNGNSFTIGSSYIDSNAIESKYNGVVFGLSPESKAHFYEHYLKEKLKNLLMFRIKDGL